VIDPDAVELGNLHRQIQFAEARSGDGKAGALGDTIAACGGAVVVRATRWTPAAAEALCGDAEVIVDGSDDPITKFAVARWARQRRRAYVIASALRYGGNVFAAQHGDACYACLFEDAPADAPTCAEAGVLGPLVGWVGGVAAEAVLAMARGERGPGATIWVLDDLRTRGARTLSIAPRADCECAS
jgi:molybdopterin/thiamine biosynthesis adenylyltransferase